MKWIADPKHSRLLFLAHHLGIAKIPVEFMEYQLTVFTEEKNFNNSKAEIKVKVDSIDSNDETRDKHLIGKEFLNAEDYPEIVFISNSITQLEEKKLKITGDLTILNTTEEVELQADFGGIVESMYGLKAGFKVTGSFNRFDFGLNWNEKDNGTPILGSMVDILGSIELLQENK